MKNEEKINRCAEMNEEALDRVNGGADTRLAGEEQQQEAEGKNAAVQGLPVALIPIP